MYVTEDEFTVVASVDDGEWDAMAEGALPEGEVAYALRECLEDQVDRDWVRCSS